MNTVNSKWHLDSEQELSEKSLSDLFENRIPAIRIKGFASKTECNELVESAKSVGFDYYKDVTPKIGKIGITQFEHKRMKKEYFSSSDDSNMRINEIMNNSFNPIARLQTAISNLGSGFDLQIAQDKNDRYFAGLIRQINAALLHIDFAPFDAPTWKIGGVENQIAWNIYLKSPKNGGECVVYNKPWINDDERFKLDNSYGYNHVVVDKKQKLKIKPVLGDLVLHNSRNYHEVLNGTGERLTMSSFIGKFHNNKLVMWS